MYLFVLDECFIGILESGLEMLKFWHINIFMQVFGIYGVFGEPFWAKSKQPYFFGVEV